MSERGEGDLDGGKDGDGTGDELHVGVESESVIDGGTSFITPAKHELGDAPNDATSPAPRTMSVLTLQMPNVALHSPSDIIGTPFATDSAPYEYPFPDKSKTTDGRDSLQPTSSVISSVSSSSLSSRSSFPMSSSSSHLLSLSTTPPSISSFAHHVPQDLSQRYSPTHPKLRHGNPPVPPALVKKRQRWSLNLSRRRNSSGSSTSAGPLPSPEAASDIESELITYPLRMTRTNEEVVARTSQRQQRAAEEEGTKVQRSD